MCHFSSIAFHHLTLVDFENSLKILSMALLVVCCSPHAHPTPRCPRWCGRASRSRHRSQSEQGQVFRWTGFLWNNDRSWAESEAEIIKFHTEFPSTARPMTETPFPCGRPCTRICVNIIIVLKANIYYTLCLLKKELKPDKEDFQSFCPKQTPHHPHCFLRRNQNAERKIQLWSICREFMQGVFLVAPPFTLL